MPSPPPPPKPITVTIADALSLSGLGRTKLYELINDGMLETVKIGRRRLIKMESLERLLTTGAD